ncbi:hypothetical protein [Streptomyces hundungensis]
MSDYVIIGLLVVIVIQVGYIGGLLKAALKDLKAVLEGASERSRT